MSVPESSEFDPNNLLDVETHYLSVPSSQDVHTGYVSDSHRVVLGKRVDVEITCQWYT